MNYPEDIFWMTFPTNDGVAIVMQPSEQRLHFQATSVAPQDAALPGLVFGCGVGLCGATSNSVPLPALHL